MTMNEKIFMIGLTNFRAAFRVDNFTMHVKAYEQKINYEWPQFMEGALRFILTLLLIHHYHDWQGQS